MEESDLEFVLDLVDRFPLREEFADNLEHPDPVPLRLLPRGRLALLARRIQMVNLVNREAPRWTKRELCAVVSTAYEPESGMFGLNADELCKEEVLVHLSFCFKYTYA
ncbi:uncharacterized protein [Triticum aestivum]|uniref:uncharacterized protein isoform X3 n=1 Tax=Triticum aestivum TaxID=4565 RepID=UPI001D0038BD|nr:uncharacterized protein LOC123087376 isoform X3 [Triticum aestivum]